MCPVHCLRPSLGFLSREVFIETQTGEARGGCNHFVLPHNLLPPVLGITPPTLQTVTFSLAKPKMTFPALYRYTHMQDLTGLLNLIAVAKASEVQRNTNNNVKMKKEIL